MPVSVELVRPDDLLHLHINGKNLRLDGQGAEGPALVLDDTAQPGYLLVTFPPQTIVEEAVYQSSPTPPLSEEASKNYNMQHPVPADLPTPARSRIGRSSRLVFRIPAGSPLRIPFSIKGLLDWDPLELNISPLAALPPEPTFAQQRNAPAISEPHQLESAIELPYRLLLSPNDAAAWCHSREAKAHRGVIPLWHVRLALRDDKHGIVELSRAHPAPLRAIWSPDYNSNRFDTGDKPRFGESDEDWDNGKVLTAMTPSDRHEIVALTSAFCRYVQDLNDFRWYEPKPIFVSRLILSALGGWLTSRGEWDPPATYRPPFVLPDLGLRRWTQFLGTLDQLTPEHLPLGRTGLAIHDRGRPEALRFDVAAAPMDYVATASIDAEAQAALRFAVPLADAGNRDHAMKSIEVDRRADPRGTSGMLLNLSEWSHIASLGRDHFVRIVYEGFLFPFGHRAALVKVTERKIVDAPSRGTLAHLVQRMFIVVREPVRYYRTHEVITQLEDGGRGLPFNSIHLTTLVTPDIANPNGEPPQVATGSKAFWVRLGMGVSAADNFKFHAVAEDIGGNHLDFSTSLVFVPFSEVKSGIPAVKDAYDKSGADRVCTVPGQQLTFAPGNGKSNTTLVVHELYFTSHGAPLNKRFGGFLPKLFKANVQLPAVELMLGTNARTDIALHDAYLKDSADNTNGLFARVVKEPKSGELEEEVLNATFQASKAGGIATPDLAVTALTRELGPLAGDPLKAARDEFSGADFFGAMADSAKVFGTFSLMELIDSAKASEGAPKLEIKPEAGPPRSIVGTLVWKPKIKEVSPPGNTVKFNAEKGGVAAALQVNVRIVNIVDSPNPPATTINGALTSFRVELLRVVQLQFESFTFSSQPDKKPDVRVLLDKDKPILFLDDLNFVETLREKLPPDLFGEGPSLDIDARRVKAGFSVGLPPVAVGVFALRDLSFGAFLELPFADGKPLLDFAFCRRDRPFNLTVAFLGGGGFFHLQVDTSGVKLLEAALEFGASASVNLGVASGGVHIMAGIYFSLQCKGTSTDLSATLGGYLRMGGELSVLGLISVSLEFYLVFSYNGKAACGIATLTVKVEVLTFSKSVAITVEKSFGGSAGDPAFEQTFNTATIWQEYADAFA